MPQRLLAAFETWGVRNEADSNLTCRSCALQEKEGKMVEADVLAVELKRLRLALSAHADKVFGLEHRKSQLRLGMEERLHQIQASHNCCRMLTPTHI